MDGGVVASQPCDDGTNCQGGYQPVDPQVTFWSPNAQDERESIRKEAVGQSEGYREWSKEWSDQDR